MASKTTSLAFLIDAGGGTAGGAGEIAGAVEEGASTGGIGEGAAGAPLA